MRAQVTLHGAAGGVTGSAFLVETDRARVLVDFGIFQGRRLAPRTNVIPAGLGVPRLDAVVITHGHLDHVGRLPLLARQGYRGPVFATDATRDLTELILEDAARIQEHEAEHENRRRGRPAREPLFTSSHVRDIVSRFHIVDMNAPAEIAPGTRLTFREAGHILGSTSVVLRLDGAGPRTLLFSGDLGSRGHPIVRDPDPGTGADLVFMESTYGDRDHRPLADTVAEFRDIVARAVAARGRLLVPTFAVGRAQQILYHLLEMFREGAVPEFPVYLDSPMARDATRIYLEHPELYDEEARELRDLGRAAHKLPPIRLTATVEESRALSRRHGPCMILAGAGMANAGRIVDHLRVGLPRPDTRVLIVGYQAQGTTGRRLVDGARDVLLRGERVPVRASIHTLGGFSAHAGRTELLAWLSRLAPARPRVALVHGEDRARVPLAAAIRDRYGLEVLLPALGETILA
jgi:metallo-beta-lactamase family protein